MKKVLETAKLPNGLMEELASAVGQPLAQLLKRPEVTIEQLLPVLREAAPEFFDGCWGGLVRGT